jgi:hypothetical protein
MRILMLFVRHGSAKYGEALAHLAAFYRRRLPGVAQDTLIIDNAPGAPAGRENGSEVIQGSNRAWEFSAWDEGLAHMGSRTWSYDLVHLATSAFGELYTRYIERFDEPLLEQVAGRAAAVGHIDYYGEPVEVLGYTGQAWIRSSFLFLPPSELATLGSLVSVQDRKQFFSGDPRAPFRSDAPLSERYVRYIHDWLTGAGTGQGVTWHSRFELDAKSLPFYEDKAVAMLNEQLLAIRLRRQGCQLVDATWMATELGRGRRSGVPVPHWRAQLAARDTDAVPLATSP